MLNSPHTRSSSTLLTIFQQPTLGCCCTFTWLCVQLADRSLGQLQVGYIDDPRGPLGLAGVVVLALTAILILEVLDFVAALKARK